VTLERFGSDDLLEPNVSGRQSAFLLDSGGQDYVGKNSYDDTQAEWMNKEPS